jgi:hypothetical protein
MQQHLSLTLSQKVYSIKSVYKLQEKLKKLSFPFSSANPPECGQVKRVGNPFSRKIPAKPE